MKLVFILFAMLCFSSADAQTSYSCTARQYCYWDSTSKKYTDCEQYDESSLFEWNEAETMFTHTIKTMKSTYYVKSKEYDKDAKTWFYKVVSDVGNKYDYVFDKENKYIMAFFNSEGKSVLLTFSVKAIF